MLGSFLFLYLLINQTIEKSAITTWAEEDRPREKLLLKGKGALTNAELVAILIGSGNREESAVDLSKRILASAGDKLNELGKLSVEDLQQFKGIGEAKAITIVAAIELSARRRSSTALERVKISSSSDIQEIFNEELSGLQHEEFHLLLLNRANKVLKKVCISKGGFSATVVDPKVVFTEALKAKASAMALIHNHPSGNRKPSGADIQLTKKIKHGGELLDILVIDHLIIAETGYFSFADENLL